jgi:hypothetical protein
MIFTNPTIVNQPDSEEAIAVVYLRREGDQSNKCVLTEHYLKVIRKNQIHIFKLSDIQALTIVSKRLLLPLIVGGVVVPLSLLAMFRGDFNPYIIMIAIFAGIYFIYLGYQGVNVLTIGSGSSGANFTLNQSSEHVSEFVNYVSAFIADQKSDTTSESALYLLMDTDHYRRHMDDMSIPLEKDPPGLKSATIRQFGMLEKEREPNELILKIDPFLSGTSIRYMMDPDIKQLRPYIHGKLNIKAIIEVDSIN